MTIIGYGLFAVALAILLSTWVLHRDVVKVYYPRKIKVRLLSPEEIAARRASLEESWEDLEERLVSRPAPGMEQMED